MFKLVSCITGALLTLIAMYKGQKAAATAYDEEGGLTEQRFGVTIIVSFIISIIVGGFIHHVIQFIYG